MYPIEFLLGPIVAGVLILIHTLFFVIKMVRSNQHHHHGYSQVHHHEGGNVEDGSWIHLSSMEISCFMGYLWRCCMTHNSMKKSTFIIWYVTVLILDGAIAAIYFAIFYYYIGTR
eukprot:TRINITY_DN3076_c0_g1_i2.p1 TRINITY_DN3076_c0_g1~~TRINITY_DN3076_c0_g1_i2.p1  ORF type:complete len:115 (-),score=13.78 TRINITY_DN3076_c0_g1_i2:19-363(-)